MFYSSPYWLEAWKTHPNSMIWSKVFVAPSLDVSDALDSSNTIVGNQDLCDGPRTPKPLDQLLRRCSSLHSVTSVITWALRTRRKLFIRVSVTAGVRIQAWLRGSHQRLANLCHGPVTLYKNISTMYKNIWKSPGCRHPRTWMMHELRNWLIIKMSSDVSCLSSVTCLTTFHQENS